MEANSYFMIMNRIQKSEYELIISPVHIQEIKAISDLYEKYQLMELINKYGKKAEVNLNKTRERTEQFIKKGFGIADAAHIAFAEASADVFISCDDKLLKKSLREKVKINVMNPMEFCIKEELK